MSEPFVGEIMLFGGTFAPRGWALCDGQLLAINGNEALFSLIGTFYGGDGRTTFALPDLRGRAPVHIGNGPGLSNYSIGQNRGAETATLTTNNLPPHSHVLQASANEATSNLPAEGLTLADTNTALYGANGSSASVPAVGNSGGGQPHTNMMPYQVVNYCIALIGVYPSRS